jgi:hypothetical protein
MTKKARARRTPVGRQLCNVEKLVRTAVLVSGRFETWRTSSAEPKSELVAACDLSTSMMKVVQALRQAVVRLESSDFVVPHKSKAILHVVGARVEVVRKHRAHFESLYEDQIRKDPGMLDDLEVVKILPSGELALRREGLDLPIVAHKSHLRKLDRGE